MELTDYELIYLVIEQTIAMQTVTMNLFSIVSSFLLVGYFISSKLTRMMSGFVIALFVSVYGLMSFALVRTVQGFMAIMIQVKTRPLLEWHPAFHTPEFAKTASFGVFMTLLIFVFVGSLYFYIEASKKK